MQTHAVPSQPRPVEALGVDARASFITKTYLHLFAAILGFIAVELVLFGTGIVEPVAVWMLGGPYRWLMVLGGFMVGSWIASRAAHTAQSLGVQYLALVGMIVIEAVIFAPMLWFAALYAPGVISSAALVTLTGFTGLTAVAFWTRKDFSFLRGLMMWGGMVALVAIVAALVFGFELGVWFSVAMIAFAGGAVLYDTSNVLHHFPEDRYVGAALELFASVALLFWYVLRLFLAMRD